MTLDEFRTALGEAEKLPTPEFIVKAQALAQAVRNEHGHSFVGTDWWKGFVKRNAERVLSGVVVNAALVAFAGIQFEESRGGDPSYISSKLTEILNVVTAHPAEKLEDRRVSSLLVAIARRSTTPLPACPEWQRLEHVRPMAVHLFNRRMTEGDGCCP